MKKYDLIIIGAGPSGIFTALEAKRINPDINILVFEKGRSIKYRFVLCAKPRYVITVPWYTTGFAGVGPRGKCLKP